MKVLTEITRSYSQILRINRGGDDEVEVHKEGKELYKGVATHIIDSSDKLTFKDAEGNQREITKRFNTITDSCMR